jgi:hypothetical protein
MEAVILLLAIIACVIAFFIGKNSAEQPIKLNNEALLREREQLQREIENKEQESKRMDQIYQSKMAVISDTEALAEKAYKEKTQALEDKFQDLRLQENLEYIKLKEQYKQELEYVQKELNSLKATRAAAVEAAKQEQTIADNPQDYSIVFDADELHDMDYLNQIKPKLRNPEIAGKVIWSTFIQKKYNNFAAKILGTEEVCGIYKITDQITKEAYIGQSVSIQTRWKDHIKSGIGAVKASASNQLYAAIKRDGIENFTFELLEACSREELNSKEKYFIGLYQTDVYGLNSTKGGS